MSKARILTLVVGVLLIQFIELGQTLTKDIIIGSAPSCSYDKSECEPFNMNLVEKIKSDCRSGDKIICQRNVTKSIGDHDADIFNLVTYNIFARPFLATHDGQSERICRIPETLAKMLPEADAVILQEQFINDCVQDVNLKVLAAEFGWSYMTPTVGAKTRGFTINGGVAIMSRWPIEYFKEHIFKNYDYKTADALSNKGVAYARINKNGKLYHVFGTHLQAEDGARPDQVRVKQLKEMNSFIKYHVTDNTARVLFGGDLNMDKTYHKESLERGLTELEAELPKKTETSKPEMPSMQFTYDGRVNELVEDSTYPPSWFDYLGHIRGYAKPVYSSMTAYHIKRDVPFSYCSSAKLKPWWIDAKGQSCAEAKNTKELSDHFPVFGVFKF